MCDFLGVGFRAWSLGCKVQENSLVCRGLGCLEQSELYFTMLHFLFEHPGFCLRKVTAER